MGSYFHLRSYQSSRETFCRSQHSQGERRTNCYIANTESEAQWYDQRQYGRRDVRGCAPPDPRSDYDRQEWIRTQHSQNSRNLEDDTAITKNKIRQVKTYMSHDTLLFYHNYHCAVRYSRNYPKCLRIQSFIIIRNHPKMVQEKLKHLTAPK